MNDHVRPSFLIISALAIEHRAVLQRLDSQQRLEQLGAVFASLGTGKNAPTGVALPILESGQLNAAVITTKALILWEPEVTLLVGLSGGFQSAGVSQSDILVATEIVDFEQQKLTADKAEVRWRSFAPSRKLINSAVSTAASDWWGDLGQTPSVHFGPVFSSEKIVASNAFAAKLQSWRRDALGVETEGSGVATAINHNPTHFLMLRGVADFADETKSDAFQSAACEAAAQFAVAVLLDWFETSHTRDA